jgi:hypothetical protein
MAYYKVRIEVWCDWNPAESDLEEIAQSMGVGDFFGGSEGDADESQG